MFCRDTLVYLKSIFELNCVNSIRVAKIINKFEHFVVVVVVVVVVCVLKFRNRLVRHRDASQKENEKNYFQLTKLQICSKTFTPLLSTGQTIFPSSNFRHPYLSESLSIKQ